MLTRNGHSMFQNPGRFSGVLYGRQGNIVKAGLRNRYFGGFQKAFGAYPNGQVKGMLLPMTAGSMASYNTAQVVTAATANMVPAMPMTATANVVLSSSANMQRVIPMTGTAQVALTASASMAAVVNASASSSISTSATALMGGIFPASASASVSVSTSATISALASMTASSGGAAPLSPEGIVQAVVDSLEPQFSNIQKNTDLIPALI